MSVLVAGCGYVGSALASLLAAEGHDVYGLRRNPGALPQNVHPVVADLSQEIPPDVLPPDLDFVFYTASPNSPDDDAYRKAYVDGPRNLLEALRSRGDDIRRFFFTSSTGVYGQAGGEWVDETSPAEPQTFSGRRLLEGERTVLGGPFPATVLRLGGIYGPGRTRSIERALQEPRNDGPPFYTNRIHRDDCAGVLQHLMSLQEPEQLYIGVDHEPAERRTVAEWLSGRSGRSGVSLEVGKSSNARSRTNKRCSNALLLAAGYEFRYPTFREGFAVLLEGVSG